MAQQSPSPLPDRMRAVVLSAPEALRVEERPVPAPGPGEVLVRVRATGICGSDLHAWKDGIFGTGVVLGHEIAGEVAALGEDVAGLAPGDLGAVSAGVPCGQCERCRAGLAHYCQHEQGLGSSNQGGFSEFLVAPAANFLRSDAPCDPAAIAFCEPLANGLRCLAFPEVGEARSAVVIGAGPIGLSCLIAARRRGVERVWVVEARERRRAAAAALGAERVLHPSEEDVRSELRAAFPHGADLVVEAAGLPETIQSAFRWTRPGGTCVLMGVCLDPVEVRPVAWLVKELTIRTSIGCSRDDLRAALELVSAGRVDGAALVTRRIDIEAVPTMLPELAAGADEIKVVVELGRS